MNPVFRNGPLCHGLIFCVELYLIFIFLMIGFAGGSNFIYWKIKRYLGLINRLNKEVSDISHSIQFKLNTNIDVQIFKICIV